MHSVHTPHRELYRRRVEIEYEWAKVANDLEAAILAGRIPPGGKLPGERELADTYGVSPGTARRAVRELRARGRVKTLPGKGSYATP